MKIVQAEIINPSANSGTAKPNLKDREKTISGNTIIVSRAATPHVKLSASEYLDKMIIEALSRGINPFTLVRKGTGKKTRYNIKELA